jgi:alkylated DNA repair dioxygenase AlkB
VAIAGTYNTAPAPQGYVQHSIVSLFDPLVPDGFQYREDFITTDEESALIDGIDHVEFSDFEMHGVVARRRVAFFGASYDSTLTSTPALPEFLLPLRGRTASWAGVKPEDFAMALINQYPPGAPIGWHRDAPQYDIVAGVSLLSSCRMRFRPYVSPGARASSTIVRRTTTHEIELSPRSGYLITGKSRSAFEHSIPAVSTLRYSITFRTLR